MSIDADALAAETKEYMRHHNVGELLQDMFLKLVQNRPVDPLTYLYDYLTLPLETLARQDENGLSVFRREKLEPLYTKIATEKAGDMVRCCDLKAIIDEHCSTSLSAEHLEDVYTELGLIPDSRVTRDLFFLFFTKAFAPLSNEMVDDIVQEALMA